VFAGSGKKRIFLGIDGADGFEYPSEAVLVTAKIDNAL
jgi:hypothetical protein